MNTGNTAGSAAPAGPSDVERADEWLLKVYAHLQEALRIPTMPWPDPGAHGHEVTARAIHSSYCALRFKIMDAIAELTATRVAVTALLADRATRGAAGAEGMVGDRGALSARMLTDAEIGQCMTAHLRREDVYAHAIVRKFCEVNGINLSSEKED